MKVDSISFKKRIYTIVKILIDYNHPNVKLSNSSRNRKFCQVLSRSIVTSTTKFLSFTINYSEPKNCYNDTSFNKISQTFPETWPNPREKILTPILKNTNWNFCQNLPQCRFQINKSRHNKTFHDLATSNTQDQSLKLNCNLLSHKFCLNITVNF